MQNLSTLRELDHYQLDEVGGGGASASWAVSTGTAVALTVGATVASPLIAGALAAGGIISAGFAIYYALADEESQSAS